MAWFKKKPEIQGASGNRKEIPEGVWIKCEGCSAVLFSRELERNQKVCPKCGYHSRLNARERIELVTDEGSFEEIESGLVPQDALGFVDSKPYLRRIQESQNKTGMLEVMVAGKARLEGRGAMLLVMDFGFIGGSMGSVLGEKFRAAADMARQDRRPLIAISSSGGARMQEGMLSLMQMAKTAVAIGQLGKAGCPFISVLTNPTTAGVMASFASLGDIIIAEPGALIGFAGPRVIEQTIRQKLPKGFQTSEFVQEHGFIDRIVARGELKASLVQAIDLLAG